MTFNQFQKIVEAYKPTVKVFQHGDFAGTGNHSVAVVFIDEDGTESRVYKYRGTYQEVLKKLGIETVTKEQIETTEATLARLEEEDGSVGFFGITIDNTETINEYKNKLERYKKAVKVWEY